MLRFGYIVPAFLFGSLVFGEDTEKKPAVEKIGEHRYRLSDIEFDAKTREVFLPVTVNMREGGPIEYVLVHETGKVHESIFVTEASPFDLQVVLKLVKYKVGNGDVFNALIPAADLKKEGGKTEERGEAVSLLFRPDEGDEISIAETVIDGFEGEPMNGGGWVLTGSSVERGDYMAEIEGSIIAVYLDPLAMFNLTHPGADTDERWGANDKIIPEIGAKGTLSIRPGGADESVKNGISNVSE